MCKLAPPEGATGLQARFTHRDGVAIPRREINDRSASKQNGCLLVAGVHDAAVGRYTIKADFTDPACKGWQSSELLDCELDWMSEERFSLSGFSQMPAYADRPARLLRQGWLCDYQISSPDDSEGDASRKRDPRR